MKVLIIGGSGLIGRRAAENLAGLRDRAAGVGGCGARERVDLFRAAA